MSFRAQLNLDGMRETKRVWKKLARRGQDMTELADSIGMRLTSSAEQRLTQTNVAPDGTPWPTSARTRARGGKVQADSGHLAATLTHGVGMGGGSVVVGSNKPYAAMRQFGGTIRPKRAGGFLVFTTIDESGEEVKIFAREVTHPARPYLGISDDDADEISSLSLEYLNMSFDEGKSR